MSDKAILRCKHNWNYYPNDRSSNNKDRRTCLNCKREEQLWFKEWKLVSAGEPTKLRSFVENLIMSILFLGLSYTLMIGCLTYVKIFTWLLMG